MIARLFSKFLRQHHNGWFPQKKSYDKPRQCIKKQRHHFENKGPYSQSYGFPSSHVQIWELDHKEGWAPKDWCFQTVVLEKTLARRSYQSTLKKINPEYSLEGLMLKFQYFGHLMWIVNSLEKTQMLGKIEGRKRRRQQRMRWLDGITTQWAWLGMNFSKFQEIVREREAWHTIVHEVTKSQTQLINLTHTHTHTHTHTQDSGESWCNILNCGVGEDSWESLGLQRDPTSPSWRRSVLGVHWKDWCWSWNYNTLATSCQELTRWKRPWCLEGMGAGGEGDDRGWNDWMASPTQWAWVWVNSGSWWWPGRPGMLRFRGSQRVGHDWVTELNW